MRASLRIKRDYYAGALLMFFGVGTVSIAPRYGMGTLMRMGSGFFPTALGVILILLGLIIAGTALLSPSEEEDYHVLPAHPQWFAWACILAGPLAFMLFGTYGGMFPGTFACVFVSALGDRTQTWKSALGLATVVSVTGVILFAYLLEIPMPVFTWGS